MKKNLTTWITTITLFAGLAIPVRLAAQEPQEQEHNQKHHWYKLVDIGTFGGPASYITGGGPGTQILNNRGMVTGGADTATPDPNAPNFASPDGFLSHAFKWQKGVLTDLGTLPGGSVSADESCRAEQRVALSLENAVW